MLEITTYKNYKELCVAMGWKITDGSSKKKQLKELDSLCTYYKEGNKFIIVEIYEHQREIVDGRKARCSELSEHLQFIILYLLSHEEKNRLVVSRSELLTLTGLINKQFYFLNNNKFIYAENRGIKPEVVTETNNRAYSYAVNYLDNSIKALENKALVSCNKVTYINITMKYPIFDKVTKSFVKSEEIEEIREASPDERNFILQCEDEILRKYGLSSKNKLSFYRLPKFREDVLELLETKGIHAYYTCYDIVGNRKYIAEEYENLQQKMNRYVDETNKQIQDKIISSIKNRKEKFVVSKENITKKLKEIGICDGVYDFDKTLMEFLEKEVKAKENTISMYLEDSFIDNVKRIVNDGVSRYSERINWYEEMEIMRKRYNEEMNRILDEE